MVEDLPAGSPQAKVWQADPLIDAAAQAYRVTSTPGALTVQLSLVPRRRRTQSGQNAARVLTVTRGAG